jgi:hypothetical protein
VLASCVFGRCISSHWLAFLEFVFWCDGELLRAMRCSYDPAGGLVLLDLLWVDSIPILYGERDCCGCCCSCFLAFQITPVSQVGQVDLHFVSI